MLVIEFRAANLGNWSTLPGLIIQLMKTRIVALLSPEQSKVDERRVSGLACQLSARARGIRGAARNAGLGIAITANSSIDVPLASIFLRATLAY